MSIIRFSHVSFAYPSVNVLNDVSFTCQPGQRLALIGPNGSGKTTVLRLAQGIVTPDSGTVESAHYPTPFLEADSTINASIHQRIAPLRALQKRFEEVSAALAQDTDVTHADEYDELLTLMDTLDVWGIDARIDEVLDGLGLADCDRERAISTLSPGQRGRLDLGLTLIVRPEILILDEPTNHLDDESRQFLIRTVTAWDGPVLFTSHDRDFIHEVATGILDLDTAPWEALAHAQGSTVGGIYQSSASYMSYRQAKEGARRQHIALYEEQHRQKNILTEHRVRSQIVGHATFKPRTESRIAQKFYADRAQTVSTRRINDDTTRLERLASVEVRKPRYDEQRILIPDPSASSQLGSGSIAVSVRQAHVPGRLAPVSFEARAGEHILLTGGNGCGKSTLLNWVHAASHSPGLRPCSDASGSVEVAVQTAFVPQHLPKPHDELFTQHMWDRGVGEYGRGFLHPKFWSTPIFELSDGNQRRAQLAVATASRASILIIDEPTNYLDIDAIETLESALMSWNGTLVIASHDRWLIHSWNDDVNSSIVSLTENSQE